MAKAKVIIQKKGKGFYFPQLDIHVAAKTEKEAKELISQGHGIDVDARVQELAEMEKAAKQNGPSTTAPTKVE